MVRVCARLDRGEDPLEAHGHHRREVRPRRHAGEMFMTTDLTTDIVAGPGGVMTDEVGVVTGDLTLHTEVSGADATVQVQYKEAEEWYTVTGGTATLKDPADAAAVHQVAVGILNRPEG
ncbi:hypothetical protein ACQPZX_48160 [Actinoplanes sp. CA-142083]|uniref:hypothetical protein n=1 Tax=Actinoplanes sp. CA-142083 TaxID=3239903 RepID=UPI003D8BEE53